MTDTPMTPDVAAIQQAAIRAIHALKSPTPDGSRHYQSGWDDGLEAAIDAARDGIEGPARDLLAEVDRLRKALSEAAAWLVRAGYPVDWSTHEPPPAALREAVIDAVHADPTGTVHGGELTRDEVAAWLAVEVRAFAHPVGEPTP
ncbi:hypothetical protein [Streptomyces microflavus]|uniref:hypothetical protein n=1 Tax=Streptomyces microflavus TaxID=1919 RepID=UPI002E312638|nr:hypothetical protein [Streptomyces microflavus]